MLLENDTNIDDVNPEIYTDTTDENCHEIDPEISQKRLKITLPPETSTDEPIKVDFLDIKDKSSLYKNVRNQYSENAPVIEASGFEFLVPSIKYCRENNLQTSAEGFEDWMNTMVKDPNFKLAVLIESIFGSALWLYHAGSRANNFTLTNAAITVFCPLFHVMGNRNYSVIELYDLYVGRLCREKEPELAANLEKNTGVNLTNLPFASQPLDARHEEINQKGQNMFKGEEVEDFQLALNILDDVHMTRSRKFDYSSLTDRANSKSERVPDYELLIKTLRVGIRASKYYSEPQEHKALQSITGKPLNEELSNLHEIAIQTRDANIRNVIRGPVNFLSWMKKRKCLCLVRRN